MRRPPTSWLLAFFVVFLIAMPSVSNPKNTIKITVEPNQNLRTISEKYLDNPDLWEDILRANNLVSAADVKPGMQLIIPVEQISTTHEKLSQSSELIQKATKNGAKIFATELVTQAIDQRNHALVARQEGDWERCSQWADSSISSAKRATEQSLFNQNVKAEAMLKYRHGTVQNRKPIDVVWNEAKLNALLIEGEKVRTLSESNAEIEFHDLSRLRLGENSQALIQKIRANLLEKTEETSINLIEGDVFALLVGNQDRKKFKLEVPGVETNIQSQRFQVSRDKEEARFANYDGKFKVAAAGEAVTLLKNQGSVVKNNHPPTKPKDLLPPVELINPADGAAVYTLDISFNWQPVNDAASYLVEVAKDASFGQIVKSLSTSQTDIRIGKEWSDGIYYWRVTAVSKDKLNGQISRGRSIRRILDNTPPFLVVKTPEENALLSESLTIVSGNAEIGAIVTVNQQKVEIDEEGNFTFNCQIRQGLNSITIEAKDPAGNTSRVVRDVTWATNDEVPLMFSNNIPRRNNRHFLTTRNGLTLSGITEGGSSLELLSNAGASIAKSLASSDGRFAINAPLIEQQDVFILEITTTTKNTRRDSLVVEWDSVPPQIIFDPIPPRVVNINPFRLNGHIDDGVALFVNGVETPLENGAFTREMSLSNGVNVINLKASDLAGNETTSRLEIIFDQTPPRFLTSSLSLDKAKGGETVEVSIEAKDDQGLAGAIAFVALVGDKEIYGYLRLDRDSSSYKGSFRVPNGISGPVKLKSVDLRDYVGNNATITF